MPRKSLNGIPFEQKLILQRWALQRLGIGDFAQLKAWLSGDELEGFNAEGVSHYHEALAAHLTASLISKDDLLRYDQNIVRNWKRITEKRNLLEGRTLNLKYFQYLALLVVEIYLDHYFTDPVSLLVEINSVIGDFNAGKQEGDQIDAFRESELNKLAFWMATGSGKTLLMHCNLLQYQYYLAHHRRGNEVNRVILLTPNEGLSEQHLREFTLSNIPASIFSKQTIGSFIDSGKVEIIDINKLAETTGEKTIDVAAFEGRNLVMVDEGHTGASSGGEGAWMSRRNALCEDGFSFEYSATFGQAVKTDRALLQTYAKSILFDYSYRYFYSDGYGKEYRILNMEDDSDEDQRYRYLSACLLAFYQQQKVFQDELTQIQTHLIEKPLWVFVGSSVNAIRTLNKRQVSDVLDVILFLAEFAAPENEKRNKKLLDGFLKGKAGLLDQHRNDIFEKSFQYLASLGQDASEIYSGILESLFNSEHPARLVMENLKGTSGEIGLRLGDNEYFGIVNVGDANSLCKMAEDFDQKVIVEEQPISTSIFQQLDKPDSNINMLVGSRKFMEGWNSWRVSTMGLLNVGRGEGTQIIQLFGRGVRLKGKNFSLKRSTQAEVVVPRNIPLVETLNVFGVRADYMRQFEEYLREEGISPEKQKVEFVMPVIKTLGKQKLKIIKVKDGKDFKKDAPSPILDIPDERLKRKPISVNWYPRVQALSSVEDQENVALLNKGKFDAKHIAFLDVDQLYFDLQDYKNERGWDNLGIPRNGIEKLLLDGSWYQLYIPPDELEFRGFDQVFRWQEIASTLLKKYTDAYYKYEKAKWESDFLEYQDLSPDDPNFFAEYSIQVEKSRQDIIKVLTEIKQAVETGHFRSIEYQRFASIMFGQHLYQPLLYMGKGMVELEIKPVALNESERTFVEDLKNFYETSQAFFSGKELYVLRNRSRGSGIGFFEAGNFYPDFILWLLHGGKQHVAFVDPKGIRNIGVEDPKLTFFKSIKELEVDLGDKGVHLHSFIVSSTQLNEVPLQMENMSMTEWERRNILFQPDDKEAYVGKIFERLK
ncbi:MAG TPA: DEAD/DEAH box helicase family protein [Anaerolineales bacterium]|nr:DEAD/DEAH box helicase family protein [Anaerolineales bacterium]